MLSVVYHNFISSQLHTSLFGFSLFGVRFSRTANCEEWTKWTPERRMAILVFQTSHFQLPTSEASREGPSAFRFHPEKTNLRLETWNGKARFETRLSFHLSSLIPWKSLIPYLDCSLDKKREKKARSAFGAQKRANEYAWCGKKPCFMVAKWVK